MKDKKILSRFLKNFFENYKPRYSIEEVKFRKVSFEILYEIDEEAYFCIKDFDELIEILEILMTLSPPLINSNINLSFISQISSISDNNNQNNVKLKILNCLDISNIFSDVNLLDKIIEININEMNFVKNTRSTLLKSYDIYELNREESERLKDFNRLQLLFHMNFFLKETYSSRIIFPAFALYICTTLNHSDMSLEKFLKFIRNLGINVLKNSIYSSNFDHFDYYENLLNFDISSRNRIFGIEGLIDDIKFYDFNLISNIQFSNQDFKYITLLIYDKIQKLINQNEENKIKIYDFFYYLSNLYKRIKKAAIKLTNNLNTISNIQLSFEKDYFKDCVKIKENLTILANSYYELSSLETDLGTERFLDNIFALELKIIHDFVKSISKEVNNKFNLDIYLEFIRKWSISEVKQISNDLINDSKISFLRNQISKKYDNLIIFVIDGLGYVQFKWLQEINKKKLMSDDFFNTLEKYLENSKEFLLGSSLITDTLIGISKIFYGLKLDEIGIPSKSSFKIENNNQIRISNSDFNQVSKLLGNKMSILKDLELKGYHSQLLTVFRKDDRFSQNSSSNIRYYVRKRTFFRNLAESLKDFKNYERNCLLVYYNYIDKEGHSIGPFSSFELSEMKKLNIFLYNFLLEIMKNRLNNQEFALLFTSDHGFFECSREKIISLNEISEKFKLQKFFICHNNRSMFLKSNQVRNKNLEKEIINNILKSLNFKENDYILSDIESIDIFGKKDSEIRKKTGDFFISFKNDGLILRSNYLSNNTYLTGNHCGLSVEEFFVPFLYFPLDTKFFNKLEINKIL